MTREDRVLELSGTRIAEAAILLFGTAYGRELDGETGAVNVYGVDPSYPFPVYLNVLSNSIGVERVCLEFVLRDPFDEFGPDAVEDVRYEEFTRKVTVSDHSPAWDGILNLLREQSEAELDTADIPIAR